MSLSVDLIKANFVSCKQKKTTDGNAACASVFVHPLSAFLSYYSNYKLMKLGFS